MILNKQTICDPFILYETQQIGIATISINNRITGEREIISIDVHGELLSHAASPVRKHVLLNLLANKGFHVSPLPGALKSFFHLLLFPEDAITLLGSIPIRDLPKDAEIEVITTCGGDKS